MKPSALVGIAFACAAMAFCLGLLDSDAASASFPGAPGLIALARSSDADSSNIWVLDWRTGEARQLTEQDYASEPAFSPDGEWIAFRSDASWHGYLNIWAVKVDGTELHRLTLGHGDLGAGSPAFSANGHWVAFSAEAPHGEGYEIDRVALTGGHRRVLVPSTRRRSAGSPSYSPDGKHLAWVQGPALLGGKAEPHIFVGDAQGRGARRLTNGSSPQFSPDGGSIVFTRERRCRGGLVDSEIAIRSLATNQESHVKQICGADLWAPTYSPDGTWIIYTLFNGSESQLGFVPVPNATPSYQPLPGLGTDLPVDELPSWQPLR